MAGEVGGTIVTNLKELYISTAIEWIISKGHAEQLRLNKNEFINSVKMIDWTNNVQAPLSTFFITTKTVIPLVHSQMSFK